MAVSHRLISSTSMHVTCPPLSHQLTLPRWDCINIDNQPVSEKEFLKVQAHFIKLNEEQNINASEFELLTATAFALFNEKKVDVGIIEVGMGGKLDATNILQNQVVCVISKIARDHESFLGGTLEDIATHKAGILRPNVPFLVNPMNNISVHRTIENYAKSIGAGPRILLDTDELRSMVFKTKAFSLLAERLQPFQRDNAVLGFLAYIEVLKSLGLNADMNRAIQMFEKLKNKRTLLGRQQEVTVPVVFGLDSGRKKVRTVRTVHIDGAHNEDAARALKEYLHAQLRGEWLVHKKPTTITWIIAMSEGKDPRSFLKTLLRPGDNAIFTTFGPVDGMPWVRPMDPKELLRIALQVCPTLNECITVPKRGAYRALFTAKYLRQTTMLSKGSPDEASALFVMTGSLYLVGDFFREHEVSKNLAPEDFPSIGQIKKDEKDRVRRHVSSLEEEEEEADESSGSDSTDFKKNEFETRLRLEIDQLAKRLESIKEDRPGRSQSEPRTGLPQRQYPKPARDTLSDEDEDERQPRLVRKVYR